jgi:arylsulfatase A-like enzyme
MRVQLGRFAADRSRFCLAYFPVAPHMPFDTILPEFNRFELGTPSLDGNYTGRYKNQLLYMDWILASLIEELERLGLLDQTLVVITNDHGEMVGEDGDRLGHGWRLDPILCNNPLIIMDSRQPGYRLNYTFGSHIDVLPTILDLINVPPPPALYQGVSLYSAAATNRPIWLNSYQQRAMIADGRYYWEEGESGSNARWQVFNIRNEDARTLFVETNTPVALTPMMDEQEEFQRSLIIHHDYYHRMLFGGKAANEPGHP